MNKLTDTFKLNNGYEIPCVGFGTWQTPDGDTAVLAVSEAIKAGYRHIDTAACYGNEVGVGKGIKTSGVKRKELFVTSKVWNTERGYDRTIAAFEKTLNDLQLDYLDLYLIHWPASASRFDDWEKINLGTWKAMTELYKAGRIKAIGVSNFLPHHLTALLKTEVKPMVNQILTHISNTPLELIAFCQENGILPEAYSPIAHGEALKNQEIADMAAHYGVSPAQLCIRYVLQLGMVALPKTANPKHMAANSAVDFEISAGDMERLKHIQRIESYGEYSFFPVFSGK